MGSIVNNGAQLIDFCSTITYLPDDTERFDNLVFSFEHDLTLNTTVHFKNNCIINGKGNALVLGDDAALIIDQGAMLELRDIELKNVSGYKVRCADDTASLVFNRVKWIQDSHYTFSMGSITFVDQVDCIGQYHFVYESSRTSTIRSNSSLLITEGMLFCAGKSDNGVEPLHFDDQTSILRIDNGSLIVSSNGMVLTRGVLDFYNAVNLDIQSTNTQTGLIWGDGTAENDVKIRFNSGAVVNHISGHLVYNNGVSNGIESTSIESRLVRYLGSHLYIAQDVTMPSFTIEIASMAVEQVQVAPGVTVLNKNSRAESPIGLFQITAQRYGDTALLLNGDGTISISTGSFPRGIVVNGTGNSVTGNGDIVSPIVFLSPAAELSISINGEMQGDATLNGGFFGLESNLQLGPSTIITGPGTVDLTTCGLLTGRQDTSWETAITWEGNGGFVGLQSNINLNTAWTFNGDCSIDGQSNTLTLGDFAEIIVSPDSILVLKNMTIKYVEGTKIRCLSDTSKILLDDVTFLMSDNITFSIGSLKILDDVDFSGSYTFSYESAQTSTIDLKSRWNFSDGATLKVGKLSVDDVEPIVFEGSSSILGLENCTLCITNSGTTITKGKISCSRDVVVDILATTTPEGLILGNGTIDGNAVLELNAGATISIINGSFVYDVVDVNGIKSSSQTVKFYRSNTSNIYIKQDLFLSNLTVEAGPLAVLNVADGKTLSYDRFVALQDDGEFEITGSRVSWFMNALTGNSSIFLNKGLIASYLAISGANNILQGNGNLTGQIILQNASSSFDYSVNGFVNNHIILSGGMLLLSGNMNLGSGVLINGPGVVNLGAYKLSIGSKNTSWITDIYWQGENAELELGANLSLSGTWTLNNSCIINGKGNELDLSGGGSIEITGGSTIQFKDITLNGLSSSNIRCLDDSSSIQLNNVELVQNGDFTFDTGSISFENNVSIMGTHTFSYESSQTSTIESDSGLFITEGLHLRIGRHNPANAIEPLYFVDSSSSINFDQSSLIITSSGMQLTRGTVTFDRDVLFDVLSTTTEHGLIWGDGNSENDVVVRFDPGSAVVHKGGYFVYNNGSPYRIYAPSNSAVYKRLEGSRSYIAKDVVFPSFKLEAESMNLAPIEIASGVSLEFDGSRIVMPIGSHTLKSLQQEAGVYKMDGSADNLTLNQGVMPFDVQVIDDNNLLSGTGRVSGLVSLQNKSSSLTIDLNGDILQSIQLSGGKIILNRDVKFDSGVILKGPGSINLDVYTLELSQKETTWDQSIGWSGDGGVLSINGILNLSATWTMQESCVIQGNGNTINFGDEGNLVIASDATLLLKNVRLKGLKNNNIRCLTNTGRLILDDVVWLQDNDFSFTMGSIYFVDDVDFAGEHTFFYQSSQTSTVDVKSSWNITNRMTLEIGKLAADGNEPLAFTDSTSVLGLNNCTFYVSEYGMRGTKGTITAERDVAVEIVSTTTQNGLIFGDGTSDNDMVFELYPGTTVRVEKGALTYDVTLQNGIRSRSKTAKIVRTDNSILYIAQNIELSNITVEAGLAATLNVAAGKVLSYNPIVALDTNGEFEVIGSRVNWFMNMLAGNQSIFVNKGILPTYVLIAGINNILHGNGIITGGIMFNDSSAHMLYRLNGVVSNNIMLTGGSLTLERDLEFTKGFGLIGPGLVTMNSNQIVLGAGEYSWTTPLMLSGSGASINLRGSLDLSSSWTVDGVCQINGNRSVLSLAQNGQIIVSEGSTLVLKDLVIQGVAEHNICCVDNDGSLIIDNVDWQQDGDYTFSIGSMSFINNVVFHGDGTKFIYQSSRTSTIKSAATLKLDTGLTFSYDPVVVASKNLLVFESDTATLALRDASLHITTTGMQLDSGRLNIKGNCCISSETQVVDFETTIDEGVTIGSGNIEDDLYVEIGIGSILRVKQGALIYNNVDSWSLNMGNAVSSFVVDPEARLDVEKTLNLGAGRLMLSKRAVINLQPGQKVVGSVIMTD